MRLSELMQGLPVLWAQGDAEISGICVDSRKVQPGDLFVAIVGRTHDGHAFIQDAIARGAAAILVQGTPTQQFLSQWSEGIRALYAVPNTRDALWQIAQRFYGDPSRTLLTIGVTGTNGKTTTTHMLQKILVAWGTPTLIVGTLGAWIDYPSGERFTLIPEGEFTTPEVYQLQSLLKTAREQGAQAVVMEVSSHALDQQRADGIHFDAAVFTNLTQDHLDYHGTMEAYAQAKLRLFTDLAEQSEKPFRAMINIDDEWGRRFTAKACGAVYTYGLSECAQVRATRVEYDLKGLQFEIESALSPASSIAGERGQGSSGLICIPLIAPYNLYNALAAAATALALGVPIDAIQRGLAGLEQVAGRFQRVPVDAEYEVIVDFAHTPDALRRVLQAGRMLNPTRLTVLFGCGGDRDATKRPLMGKIAAELADRVILTSDNPRTEDPHAILEQILAGVPAELRSKVARVEVDRRRAIEYALNTAQTGELILLAGKGHEPYQIIGTEKVPFSDIEIAKEVAGAKR
ncbi:MAG: UDP-N-acetylmuramoyl-L-alanyl-D-glutamate--2,6-diaminopimelate ligase [Fimbriimonadales bacterium]|nr:MAG: UDP-N-acetylmuramoyl-L-alanyl-D-glutamate--2,6-diaminopimelate ligase [Fimbriimonadales bacterium]